MMEPTTTPMTYDCDSSTRLYQKWYPSGLHHVLVEHVNLEYFGDLIETSLVEFGCGDGSFLKKCLAKGAMACLGFDVNESMINAGKDDCINNNSQQNATQQLRFEVRDCFEPIDDVHQRFDFAVCQFLLHECSTDSKLLTFIRNAFQLLKPGGKLFIGQCPFVANTAKDQETIANLCGYRHASRNDSAGKDPFFARSSAFYPSAVGRPFTRERMFTFSDHYWSKEKLIRNLTDGGFVNVQLLPQTFPDDVPLFEAKQVQALEEPIILIGAEKPIPFLR